MNFKNGILNRLKSISKVISVPTICNCVEHKIIGNGQRVKAVMSCSLVAYIWQCLSSFGMARRKDRPS